MLVYRLESNSGEGPYNDWNPLGKKLCKSHAVRRPTLVESGLFLPGREQFCACESLKELRNWFRGWWKQLLVSGYRAVVYDVSEEFVNIGYQQLLFVKNKAKFVRCVSDAPIKTF